MGEEYFLPSFSRKIETLELVGYEYINYGMTVYEYPEPVLALNNWLFQKKKLQKFKLFNESRNGNAHLEDLKSTLANNICAYIADSCPRTKIEDDIFLEIKRNENEYVESSSKKSVCCTFSMILTSKRKNSLQSLCMEICRKKKLGCMFNGRLFKMMRKRVLINIIGVSRG
jgi:hypothetical protein